MTCLHPLLSRSPDTLTEPDEDPISDLLNNSSQAPFSALPTGVEMYGRTIRLDGSINQDNPSASDTIVRYIGDIQLKTDTGPQSLCRPSCYQIFPRRRFSLVATSAFTKTGSCIAVNPRFLISRPNRSKRRIFGWASLRLC